MKITKTLVIAALVAGSLVAWNSARAQDTKTNTPPPAGQPGPRPGMRGGQTLEQLTTELNLTDDQKPKVKAILDDRDQKIKALRGDTTLSREDMRTKMQEVRTATNSKMKEMPYGRTIRQISKDACRPAAVVPAAPAALRPPNPPAKGN